MIIVVASSDWNSSDTVALLVVGWLESLSLDFLTIANCASKMPVERIDGVFVHYFGKCNCTLPIKLASQCYLVLGSKEVEVAGCGAVEVEVK